MFSGKLCTVVAWFGASSWGSSRRILVVCKLIWHTLINHMNKAVSSEVRVDILVKKHGDDILVLRQIGLFFQTLG